MDTLYTFWESITHHKTKSVHFLGLVNSATKERAFAAILDGSVVTWGSARFGGNSTEVQGNSEECSVSKQQALRSLPSGLMEL